MEERYEPLKELGSGNFGVARLVRDKKTKELAAVKYIERGKKVIDFWISPIQRVSGIIDLLFLYLLGKAWILPKFLLHVHFKGKGAFVFLFEST